MLLWLNGKFVKIPEGSPFDSMPGGGDWPTMPRGNFLWMNGNWYRISLRASKGSRILTPVAGQQDENEDENETTDDDTTDAAIETEDEAAADAAVDAAVDTEDEGDMETRDENKTTDLVTRTKRSWSMSRWLPSFSYSKSTNFLTPKIVLMVIISPILLLIAFAASIGAFSLTPFLLSIQRLMIAIEVYLTILQVKNPMFTFADLYRLRLHQELKLNEVFVNEVSSDVKREMKGMFESIIGDDQVLRQALAKFF
jgi:hypothetical protein